VDSDPDFKQEIEFLGTADSGPSDPESVVSAAYRDTVPISPRKVVGLHRLPPRPRVWTSLVVGVFVIPLALAVGVAALLVSALVMKGTDVLTHPGGFQQWLKEFVGTRAGLFVMFVPVQIVFFTVAMGAAILSPESVSRRLGLVRGGLPIWTWIVFALATPLLGYLWSFLLALASGEGGMESDQTRALADVFRSHTGWFAVAMILTVGALPGVAEELLYRGYVQRRLLARWHPLAAIGVAGVLFSVAHLDRLQILQVLPLGLWLGIVAWRCESVLPSMLCHFVNNVVAVIGVRIEDNTRLAPEIEALWTAGLFGISVLGVLAAVVVMAAYAGRRVEPDAASDADAAGSGIEPGMASGPAAAARSTGSGALDEGIHFLPDPPFPPVPPVGDPPPRSDE